ncbi:MAG: hypothetical protein KKC26_04180 [Nanoarchaeota archaeon]|nr:hypothetical protein [Nanoarchaeota archaeon]
MNKKELLEQLCKLNSTEPLNLTEKTYDFLKKEDLIEIIPKQEYVARLNSNDEALNKTDAEYKKISHELEDCKSTIQNWPQNKKRLLITEKRKAKEQNNERIILYWKEKQPELEATLQQTKKSLEALLDKQSKLKLCTKTNYGFTMISDKGKKCLFFLERNTLDNSLNIQEMNETLAIYNFIEVRYTRFKETYDLLQQKGFEATPAVVNLALSASALKDEPKAALERITKISYFLESKDFKEKKNNIKLISALIPINYADLHVMLDDWHKSVEIAITGWSNCYNTYIEMAHAIKIKDSTPTKRFYQTELMTHSIKKRLECWKSYRLLCFSVFGAKWS